MPKVVIVMVGVTRRVEVQARVSNSITPLSRFGYRQPPRQLDCARLATNDTHAQVAMKRCWLGSIPGSGLDPAGPHNSEEASFNPQPAGQPKDRAELADRAQARRPAADQSVHPYPHSPRPRQ
jgi:hypothetical protein